MTPVTPSSFPRSEPYAGPRADTSLFHPTYGNGRDSSAGSDLVTSALCVHPSSSSLETDDIFTKAEPFSILHEDTENLSTSSAPEDDVISLVNDTMVKTVEVPDMGTFEPSLATDSNLTEVELPEHVNVLFVRSTYECNLTSDVERDLKQLLLDHSERS